MKYFVPSKTFLTGEYSVLVGGSALGLATGPCFEISYLQQEGSESFHPDSPAGRYLKDKRKSLGVQFYDPYMSRGVQGGFGRSTAEYFAAAIPDLLTNKKGPIRLKEEYLSFFEKEKVKPSGMDLLIQYLGKVSYLNAVDNEFKSIDWNFPDLNFFLVSTGLKIKTHEHLEMLDLARIKDLPHYSNQVIDSYLNKSTDKFIQSLEDWTKELKNRNLTHLNALDFKKSLEKIKKVISVKPCGALGADVMIVFCSQVDREEVRLELRKEKFKIQASREDLVEGLVKYVG